MNSQDQQDNSQNGFLKLPLELHNEITSYLTTLNIKHLSQTSAALRNVYNPILYRKCKITEQYHCEIVPETYRIIRPWVLFYPSKFSWFPNQAVQNIVVNNEFSITDLQHHIKPSDYPSLTSFKVIPEKYSSQLVITQQNPTSFAGRDLKLPHLSTNDLLPALKSDEHVHLIICHTKPGSYYVLQCNNMEIRSMITSLNLSFLRVILEDGTEIAVNIATELKAFPNLKDLKIWCADGCDYEPFKAVIESVTKLESLDSLMIHYESYYESYYGSTRHLKLLDNLQGSWKTFNLGLGFDWRPFTSDIFLRLPTVTNLMLLTDRSHYNYFEGNFEFGSVIKQLTFPFYSAGKFLSEYHHSQNVLDNLTTLKVVFPPAPHRRFYKENIEMVVFTKVLPNLKNFEIQMQDFKIFSNRQLDGFPELSKTFFSLVPFGEFDILNYESIKPYIMELKRSALLKWKKDGNKVKILKKCIKLLERANEDSNIYDLYYNFFLLQFLHSAFKVDTFFQKDNNEYSKHRAIISVLLLRLLQYTPNLETLTLLGIPLHEEFAAFHRLVKYHKNLKRVSARMIFIGDIGSFYHKNDEVYLRYRQFAKPVRYQIHDNQVFVTEPVIFYDVSDDLEGFEYNVEGFRKGHASKLFSDPDRNIKLYEFEDKCEYLFKELLPLNANEVKDYIDRQDMIKRSYKNEIRRDRDTHHSFY